MGLATAVAAPRISLGSASSSANTLIEPGFSAAVRSGLEQLGYDLDSVSSIGAVQAILTYPGDDTRHGAADPRRDGGVAGEE